MADVIERVQDVDFADALGERYLSYALSTIMARSLPDVRDGLKPVHRRILHAMNQLRIEPRQRLQEMRTGRRRSDGQVPSARRCRDLRRAWCASRRISRSAIRVVDGQGNFGNIDGDNAAAMRYTESRMSAVAQALLEGIDEDAVDFRETYDGENSEPVVLPARFPNLLANGAAGIAVGMATSVPPHNVGEICAALTHLIDNPRCPVAELVALMPGPGLPDRRHTDRAVREHPGRLRDRPRQLPAARALGEGAAGARALPDRRHRDALSGPEEPADREDRCSCSRSGSCRSSPMSATNWPRISASSSSRRPATSTPTC